MLAMFSELDHLLCFGCVSTYAVPVGSKQLAGLKDYK